MPVDASIYNLMRPAPAPANPLAMAGQAMQVRNLMGAGKLQDLQTQQVQAQMAAAPAAAARAQETHDVGIKAKQAETTAKNIGIMRDLIAQASSDADMPVLRDMSVKLFGPDAAMKIAVPDRFDPQWQMDKIRTADDVLKQIEAQKSRAVTTRGQDITASTAAAGRATTERGQDITAKTARRGQDIAAGTVATAAGTKADTKAAEKKDAVAKTLNTYVEARNGLLSGLGGTVTGPVMGRMPALTTEQQVGEGAIAAMGPVLKQLFRVAGEGVFTDRDQALLMDMIPKRTDTPEARAEKMANIDRIVTAKLGVEVPPFSTGGGAPASQAAASMRAGGIKFLGFEP